MTDLTARPPIQAGPMPFRMLLDEAMRRTRRHFLAIFPAVAIPLALLSATTGVLQALMFQRLTAEAGIGLISPAYSLQSILLGLVQGLLTGVGVIALQKAVIDATAGRLVDMKEAWRFAVRPPVLGTAILYGVALFVALMVCCLPILYVAPLLSLVIVVMVEEKTFGPDALSRSATLMRYNPQGSLLGSPIVKALVLIILVIVISVAVSLLVTLPFQMPMFISTFRDTVAGKDPSAMMDSMSKWLWIQIPARVLQTLTTIAVSIYSTFGYALLFFDVRGRKEGSDLAAEIHSVFGPGPGEPVP